jgi:hypothetical protein
MTPPGRWLAVGFTVLLVLGGFHTAVPAAAGTHLPASPVADRSAEFAASATVECPATYQIGSRKWELTDYWRSDLLGDPGIGDRPLPSKTTCTYRPVDALGVGRPPGQITFQIYSAKNVTTLEDFPQLCPSNVPTDRAIQASWGGQYPDGRAVRLDDPGPRALALEIVRNVEERAVTCPGASRSDDASPTVFGGYLLVYNEKNQVQDLEDAMVVLHVVEDGSRRAYTTYSDDTGLFGFAVPDVGDDATYQIEVRLQDRDGMFGVYRTGATTLLPVGYTSAPRSVSGDTYEGLVLTSVAFEAGMDATEPVRLLADETLRAGSSWSGAQLHEAALVYSNVQTALEYARDDLGVPVTSTGSTPKLSVLLNASADTTKYRHGQITIGPATLDVTSPLHPETEYHEVGHYVHDLSGMGGVNNIYQRVGENHAGALNEQSIDSVTEGWADFFAVLVRGDPDTVVHGRGWYAAGDVTHNLQRNHYGVLLDPEQEEWRVASLLWDLMDDDPTRAGTEQMDHVAMGRSRLWAVLDGAEDLSDVRSLYEAVKADAGEPLPGPNDQPTTIDLVFVAHGFYSENNGQARWQQGEPIGYADGYDSSVDPAEPWGPDSPPSGIRRSPDSFAGPWLDPTVRDGTGQVLTVSSFRMEAYSDDWTDVYVLERAGVHGRVPFFVPPGADGIRLTARVPGYGLDVVDVSGADYQRYVDTWGRETVGTVEMTLPARTVAPPAAFRAERRDDGTVSLTWTPPGAGSSVLVVRQAVGVPATPGDGVVVYEGTGGGWVDRHPAPVDRTYYAAFVVDPDGGLSRAAVAAVTAPQLTRAGVSSAIGTGTDQPDAPAAPSTEPPAGTATPGSGWGFDGLAVVLLVGTVAVLVVGFGLWRLRSGLD